MSQLLPSVSDLVGKLKRQVSHLKDLPHRKQSLQQKIDSTKRAYQELLGHPNPERDGATGDDCHKRIVCSWGTPPNRTWSEVLPDADAADPVPAAVAGFISTLGVTLTEEQQLQLQTMLNRPLTAQDEEAKRRKTEKQEVKSCG